MQRPTRTEPIGEVRRRLSASWLAEGPVEITHHGYPVALITPFPTQREVAIRQLAEELVDQKEAK